MRADSLLPMIAALAVSIGIAVFGYSLLIHLLVDGNLEHLEPEPTRVHAMHMFYEQPHDGAILLLGASYVVEGIDSYIVEDSLRKKNITIPVYDLGINNDNPLNRLTELDSIIASRPEQVAIGLSYRVLANRTEVDEERLEEYYREMPVAEREEIRVAFQPAFNDAEERSVPQTVFERFFDKRKFLLPAGGIIFDSLFDSSDRRAEVARQTVYATDFKDPWIQVINWTEKRKVESVRDLEYEGIEPEETNLQLRALRYTITRLQQQNIGVSIINMPQHPLFLRVVNESDRQIWTQFLDSTGVPWYDYESEYPSEYFTDTAGHLNAAGRSYFSHKVAAIVGDSRSRGQGWSSTA